MMLVKNLYLAALCLGLVSAAALFLGYSIREEAGQVNEDWETVTLRQWIDGDVKNERFFELSNFRTAKEGVCFDNREIVSLCIPLYPTGQAEGRGESIRVVARLSHTGTDEEIWNVLRQPLLKIQDHGDSPPPYAKELADTYPKIDWDKVRTVSVDDDVPTLAKGNQYLIAGGLGTLICLLLVTAGTKLWYREYSAKKAGFANQSKRLEMAPTGSSEVGRSSLNALFSRVSPYFIYLFFVILGLNIVLALGCRGGLLDDATVFPILFITAPIALCIAVSLLACYFLITPKLMIQRRGIHEIPEKILSKLNAEVEEFQLFGFELQGYAFTKFRGEKHNAFLLSADQKRLVEITHEAGQVTAAVLGITNDGLVFMACNNGADEDILIDATSTGVPLVIDMVSSRGTAETIACFEEFHDQVSASGGRLLLIDPRDAFHVMHYDAITCGWWAYHSSNRFSKPESLPSIEEVTHDGYQFNFRRSEELDNAYELTERTDSYSSSQFINASPANAMLNE